MDYELDFSTFLLSLSSAALISLGQVPNPTNQKFEYAPTLAKQNIDIIALLKEKTRGNLTKDEQDLIDNLLSELRLNYIKQQNERSA